MLCALCDISTSMCSLHYHIPCVKVMHLWKKNSDTNMPRLTIATQGGSSPRAWRHSGTAGLGTSLQERKKVFILDFEWQIISHHK